MRQYLRLTLDIFLAILKNLRKFANSITSRRPDILFKLEIINKFNLVLPFDMLRQMSSVILYLLNYIYRYWKHVRTKHKNFFSISLESEEKLGRE